MQHPKEEVKGNVVKEERKVMGSIGAAESGDTLGGSAQNSTEVREEAVSGH